LAEPSRSGNSGGDLVEARAVFADDEQPYREKIALLRQPELGALIVFLAANELDRVEFARRRLQPFAVFDAIALIGNSFPVDDVEGHLPTLGRNERKLATKSQPVIGMLGDRQRLWVSL